MTVRLLLAVCILSFAPRPATAGEPLSLTIAHTNDIHAHLTPFDAQGGDCDPKNTDPKACRGGVARLKTLLDAVRASGGPVLTLDAGDWFQGTLFYTALKDKPVAKAANALGYQAMVPGNHEFDDGPAVLAAFLDAADFPLVCANCDTAREPLLAGRMPPFVILPVGGDRIGVFGLANEGTAKLSRPGPNVAFGKAEKAARKAVADLSARGVDKIIALSHLGLDKDKALAGAVDGIDVIVGGHSHQLLSNTAKKSSGPYPAVVTTPSGGATLVVTAGYWGRHLGVLGLDFDAEGRLGGWRGNPKSVDRNVPEEPGLAAMVREFEDSLAAYKTHVLGRTEVLLDGGFDVCRVGECLPGDLAAEALLAAAAGHGAVAAFHNGGGIRGGFPVGEITLGQVMTVFPFANHLVIFDLAGADLLAALENGLSHYGGSSGTGRFPQVAGLRYAFDPDRPSGARLVSAEMRGPDGVFTPVDPAATYRLATTDFLLDGGDGYTVFRDAARDVWRDGSPVSALLAEAIATKSPLRLEPDGRIRKVAAKP